MNNQDLFFRSGASLLGGVFPGLKIPSKIYLANRGHYSVNWIRNWLIILRDKI